MTKKDLLTGMSTMLRSGVSCGSGSGAQSQWQLVSTSKKGGGEETAGKLGKGMNRFNIESYFGNIGSK